VNASQVQYMAYEMLVAMLIAIGCKLPLQGGNILRLVGRNASGSGESQERGSGDT
jgi:hypothetical protein